MSNRIKRILLHIPIVRRFVTVPNGSVFTKIATAEAKKLEATGRIIAIDAANAAAKSAVADLKVEAARVHADSDNIHTSLDGVLSSL
jgi:hypothetical protein